MARMGYDSVSIRFTGSGAVKLHLPTTFVGVRTRIRVWPILLLWALGAASVQAVPVSHLEVRVVTGAEELSAGSSLELRIYETGKSVRRLPLVHGEAWLRDSTHIIPVKLGDALDPRNVVRFSLYYRSASPLAPELEIVAAEVELPSAKGPPEKLLDATLSGVIARQGELATMDRDQAALMCRSDSDCDDKRTCNGQEHCSPRAAGADARGCVKGTPVVCPVNQVCGEGVGCRGLSAGSKSP
ncbi:MAG: hypothetical protein QOF32_2046 [Gammaproteobacteria bacterium]|nr:hypothetical protein [Gammaproteobacteria bacterium]